jgi:tRNA threonylcarbamoyladenosine biosynthesis protein TsaB
MKILAVDTATNSCSVAVTDSTTLLAETTLVTAETHSKHLLKMIDEVMEMAGVDLSKLDGFAVTRGPGSFTGLRIGLSVVKGLAVASGKHVVGISSLEALASQFPWASVLICAMVDARKSEVYVATYRSGLNSTAGGILEQEMEEQVTPPEKALEAINEPCLFVGSGAMAYQDAILKKLGKKAFFAPSSMSCIRAAVVAHLGLNRFQTHSADDIAALKPHYIRKSDAELKLGKD